MNNIGEFFNKLEFLSSLISGIAHDIGHFGLNNAFLVKSKHELAFLHNDVSPLENMHCTKLYDILRDPKYNILSKLSSENWTLSRKQIVTCILHTDMAFHFDSLKTLEVFQEVNGVYFNEFMNNIEFGPVDIIPDCLQDQGIERTMIAEKRCF